MMNSRLKWIAVLAVLTMAVWACKKEEKTEGMSAPAQTEQKAPAQEAPQMAQPQEGMKPAAEGMMATAQGKEIYEKNCVACHGEGMAGAPKVGNMEAWSTLIAKGPDTLTENAINGIGTMPPKGGNPDLSDEDVRAAVDYMIEQSR